MKSIRFLFLICTLIVIGAFSPIYAKQNVNIVETKVQVAQNRNYEFIRNLAVYFVNNSGLYSRANMKFELVKDVNGNLFVAYSNNYGTSYYRVQYAKSRDFKYTFYMQGWWFFN